MAIQNKLFRLLAVALFILSACSKSPEIDNKTMLDGDLIFDPSLYNPAQYLVSERIPDPNTTQQNTPVIIAVHGYSASTFEWDEFRTYCEATTSILISQVLLGGHGRTYKNFKESSWEEWQEPIMTEYNALRAKGYKNISFAGSSTACPLVMDLIKKGKIGDRGMKNIFLIDPIVIPSEKLLTLVGLVGPMIGYMDNNNTPAEEGHYYHFLPQETMKELLSLTDKIRKDLQKGYRLPVGTRMKVYKSIKDPSADPVSAVLIYKGLKNSDGSNIAIEMVDSGIHVFTRLNGRASITQHDREIQTHVFDDMIHFLMQ